MNILLANWSWYPSGGDWTYIKSICELYEAKGHHIVPFSMKNEKNQPTDYDKYFLEGIDYKKLNNNRSLKSGMEVFVKSIYSVEAKRKLNTLLNEHRVDVAQLNIINNYQTPSIIPVLKRHRIPIIWRVVDYKMICPNRKFAVNDKVCEACYKHKYFNCAVKKCIKDSALASFIAAVEGYTYWLLPYYKMIDKFLFQSEFSRDIHVKFGIDKKKTQIIENPYDCSNMRPEYDNKNFILYFGRLEKIKGIYTLLNAMKLLPDIELKIVGEGTETENCMKLVEEQSISNVTFLGPMWKEELEQVLKATKFVVVPSEWYEPSPYVVLQSFAFGKPVIATNMGGLNDLIKLNVNGIFSQSGNPESLANAIRYLYKNESMVVQMGKDARQYLENHHHPDTYYNETMDVFNNLINKKKSRILSH